MHFVRLFPPSTKYRRGEGKAPIFCVGAAGPERAAPQRYSFLRNERYANSVRAICRGRDMHGMGTLHKIYIIIKPLFGEIDHPQSDKKRKFVLYAKFSVQLFVILHIDFFSSLML